MWELLIIVYLMIANVPNGKHWKVTAVLEDSTRVPVHEGFDLAIMQLWLQHSRWRRCAFWSLSSRPDAVTTGICKNVGLQLVNWKETKGI